MKSDKSLLINRVVMLKFRPIAPKPVGGEAVSGGGLQEKPDFFTRNRSRAKRKYVRVRPPRRRQSSHDDHCCRKSRSKSKPMDKELGNGDNGTVTLQLMPENFPGRDYRLREDGGRSRDDVVDDDKMKEEARCLQANARSIDRRTIFQVIESWIIIECITDAFMEGLGLGLGLGFSDKEKLNSIQMDTNPGFVSDRLNNVLFVNDAYKKMIIGEEHQEFATEFRSYLVVKEKMPNFGQEFACRVRVEYNWNGRKCARTVPCDVWRMEFGGFAWKMDLKAALSLGL